MSRRRVVPGRVAAEDGGVLVTVTLFLPVLILFAIFVVDVGNWFEHKRHLQMQADAGALAGGGLFKFPCDDDPIVDETRTYAGDPEVTGSYNRQIGGIDQENVHVLINSKGYWNEGGTNYSDGGQPCQARMVDVKITESDLPWFFAFDAVPAVNAHARVEIRGLNSHGALPIAVPDVNPKRGAAIFINEATGAVLATTPLTKKGVVDGLAVWDNSELPIAVPIDGARIGVRIVLSGGSSVTCGDLLVECYDFGSPNGILFARGWSSSGSGAQPNPPIARSVTLFPGSCPDPYFSSVSSTCSVGVDATVDFGSLAPADAKVTAVAGGKAYPLAYDSTSGTWRSPSTAMIPVAAGAGPIPIELQWEETKGTVNGNSCSTSGGNKCKGTFGVVQRTFSANSDRSGPIKLAQIWENGAFWANSFETGTTPNVVVRIGLEGTLQDAQSVDDPVVAIRVSGGSRNQSIDCDPNLPNLRDEIGQGCGPLYKVNEGSPCPPTAPDLWAGPQPWDCVAIQTGGAVGQVEQGMSERILGGAKTCTAPNNWHLFPDIPPDDPRIVPLFLAPFGAFDGSGNDVIPVLGFATFYVTGWSGSPCPDDDPVPDKGYIVGHFIKYIFSVNDGGAGDDLCDFSAIGSCIAVLTE